MNDATGLLAKPTTTDLIVDPSSAVISKTGAPPKNGKPATDEAIRMCAYLKWLSAGTPAGDGVEFWLAAEKEILSQAPSDEGPRAKRPSKPR
jgi:hypothetical protein